MLGALFGLALLGAGVSYDKQLDSFDPIRTWSVDKCPTVCTVTSSGGGVIADFQSAALDIAWSGRKLKIDGPCASACTISAVMLLPYAAVCVTPRAELLFHQGAVIDLPSGKTLRRFVMRYPANVTRYIDAHGGEPTEGWVVMSYVDSRRFFPLCRS